MAQAPPVLGQEVPASLQPPPPVMGQEVGRAPFNPPRMTPGSERNRPDTNIIGIDHEKLRQAITDWAATSPNVPERFRQAAARGGAYFGDVLASLAEMISSPEAVAGGAAKAGGIEAIDAAVNATKRAAAKAPQAAIRTVAAVGDVVHPDVIGAVSPRAGKVVNIAQRLREKLPPPEAAPTASSAPPPAPTPPKPKFTLEEWRAAQDLVKEGYSEADVLAAIEKQRPVPAANAPAAAPAAVTGEKSSSMTALQTAARKAKTTLSAAEANQGEKWIRTGKMDPDEALRQIQTSRELVQRLKLQTPDAAAASVGDRNASGRWPE